MVFNYRPETINHGLHNWFFAISKVQFAWNYLWMYGGKCG